MNYDFPISSNFRVDSCWKRELTMFTSILSPAKTPSVSPPFLLLANIIKVLNYRSTLGAYDFFPREFYGFSAKQRKQSSTVSLFSSISSFFFIQLKGMWTFSLPPCFSLTRQLSLRSRE